MTGYTHQLIEEKQTLPEFALSCARAFGALVSMREERMDAAVPQRLEPSPYYAIEIAENQASLYRLGNMSDQERRLFALGKIHARRCEMREGLEKCRERIDQMLAMLEKVEGWEPPTAEHVKLKSFMIQQLTDSINWEMPDYYKREIAALEQQSSDEWLQSYQEKLKDSLDYSYRAQAEEIERTEKRNEWLAALRRSLESAS